jgi:hypothetical protein
MIELIKLESLVKYRSLYFSIILFTDVCNSVEFNKERFLACSTNNGIKDFINSPIISIKPDIDVIAARELLNFNLVFRNKIKGFKMIVIIKDIDKYINIGLIRKKKYKMSEKIIIFFNAFKIPYVITFEII